MGLSGGGGAALRGGDVMSARTVEEFGHGVVIVEAAGNWSLRIVEGGETETLWDIRATARRLVLLREVARQLAGMRAAEDLEGGR
jgi:hypothetical protein